MNSNPSRITVTVRGKKLQDDLRIETAEDFYLQTTSTRSVMQSSFNFGGGGPLTLNSETCRTGYFRPKYDSHVVIKIPDSQKVYPNYMKKDPREYTTKHVCAWTPKSTSEGAAKLPTEYAPNQSVHHTLWKPELDGIIRNASIKDTNNMIAGRFGYIPLHMTNCKYPESKFILNTEGGEISRMLSPINGSQRDLSSSKCMSDLSMTMNSGFRGRDNNFKSSLISTTSNFGLKSNLQKRRNIHNNYSSTRRAETSVLSVMNTSMNRIFMRSSDEKIEQIIGKQKRSQKEFEEILDRVGEKIKQKYDQQEESASYLPELKEKLQKEKATLEELTIDRDREKDRYQGRLLERSNLKYGKAWKNHSNFLNKCYSQKEIEQSKKELNVKTNSGAPKINFLKRVAEAETVSSPIPERMNSKEFKKGYIFNQNDSSFHPKDDLQSQNILPSYNKL